MKRALIILLLLACCVLSYGQTASDYRGMSAAQLSAMSDYVTIPNTNYWNTHAYIQLYTLFNQIFKIGGDSTGIRFVSMYDGLREAIYDSTNAPVSGFIFGTPNATSNIRDTTIVLTTGTDLLFPLDYHVDWKTNDYRDACTDELFQIWADSNITVRGGIFYGHSDDNYVTGNVLTYVGVKAITVDGLSVVADSLKNWYIIISAGTGSGQSRRVTANTATSAGSTTITTSTNWDTPLNATSDYLLTPMDEGMMCFNLKEAKHVTFDGVQINDFPGDAIAISNTDDIKIINSTIRNPFHWFELGGGNEIQNLVGRQGISIAGRVTATDNYPGCSIMGRDPTVGTSKTLNTFISNCKIIGGLPGGIDIEPVHGLVDGVVIDNCIIDGGYRGIAIENTAAAFWNIKVSNTIITDITSYAVSLVTGTNTKNIEFNNVTFKRSTGLYVASTHNVRFVNCIFDSLKAAHAVTISGTNSHIEFISCTFSNNTHGAIYADATLSNLIIDGCHFINGSTSGAGVHGTIYLSGNTNVVIRNNLFEDTGAAPYQGVPMILNSCDSVYVTGNIAHGNVSNVPTGSNSTNVFWSGNEFGPAAPVTVGMDANTTYDRRGVVLADTVGLGATAKITSQRVGINTPGDTTVAFRHEVSRNQLVFPSYRDSHPLALGVKLVGQNIGAWSGVGTANLAQRSNLLIYTTQGMPGSNDDTRQAMILNPDGFAINDGGYMIFTADTTDSAWYGIGTAGYGFHDASGVLQAKNSGGTWTKLLAFIGAKDPTYVAAIGDLFLSSKRDTLIYKASADSCFYLLMTGNKLGHR